MRTIMPSAALPRRAPAFRYLAVFVLALAAAACADLTAIRKFADTSAESAQYTRLAQDYAAAPLRQKRYQPAERHAQLDERAKVRAEQVTAILAEHALIEEYMRALGALAADEAPVFDSEIDGLTGAVTKAKFATDAEAGAAATIAKLVLRAAADGWRQARLRELIEQGNAPLQTIIAALRDVTAKGFLVEVTIEQAAARSHYNTLIVSSKDPAGRAAIQEWAELRMAEIAGREAAARSYDEILARIAEGHQALYDGRNDIGRKELLRQLQAYAKMIQKAAKALM
ncbi:MAG: hypothetical protein IT561_16720 [Alphaproteobacteria bacterium]|nr:hypothetical protein [Alphaproteobacteria bacterium]